MTSGKNAPAPAPAGGEEDVDRGRTPDARTLLDWVLAHQSDALAVLDPELRVLVWSRGCERITGVDAKGALGRPVVEVFPPLRESDFRARFARALAGESVRSEVISYETKGPGSAVYGSSLLEPWRSEGQIRGVMVLVANLTSAAEYEQRLTRSRSELDYVLAVNPAVVYRAKLGPPYRAEWVSASAGEVLGHPSEHFLREPPIWFENIHPEDRALVASTLGGLGVGRAARYRYRFRRADGTYRWIEEDAQVVAAETADQPADLIGCCRDVTTAVLAEAEANATARALSESQARLRALFDDVPAVLVVLDDDGRILDLNPMSRRFFCVGAAPPARWRELFARDDGAFAERIWSQLSSGALAAGEGPVRLANGADRYLRYRARADVVPGVHFFVGWDMTAENEVRESRDRQRAQQGLLADLGREALSGGELGTFLQSTVRALSSGLGGTHAFALDRISPGRFRVEACDGVPGDALGRVLELDPEVGARSGGIARLDVPSALLEMQAPGARLDWCVATIASRSRPRRYLAVSYARGVELSPEDSLFLLGVAHIASSVGLRLREQRIRARLLARVMDSQEEERRSIARELHDTASQSLTAVLVGLRAIEGASSLAAAQDGALRLREISSTILGDLGRLARGLHPRALDDLGLLVAAQRFVENFARSFSLRGTFEAASVSPTARWPVAVEATLYAILQEALTNVARHARAKSVSVILSTEADAFSLRVRDDGVGFDPEGSVDTDAELQHFGLHGMRERAARLGGLLETRSAPGEGTEVWARIPSIPLKE